MGLKSWYKSDIFSENAIKSQMSHTCQQYKLIFGPKNPIFNVLAGLYFLSLFFEHPVSCCWGLKQGFVSLNYFYIISHSNLPSTRPWYGLLPHLAGEEWHQTRSNNSIEEHWEDNSDLHTGCPRKKLTLFADFPSKSANKVNFFWDTLYNKDSFYMWRQLRDIFLSNELHPF